MRQMAEDSAENEENDPLQVQISNIPETRDSPVSFNLENRQQESLRTRLTNWWSAILLKWKYFVIAAIIVAAIIIIIIIAVITWSYSGESEVSNQQSHNSSLEGGTEKATENTTAVCLRNQTEYYLCSSDISDYINRNFSISLPGRFECPYYPFSKSKQNVYFIATLKVTWSEAMKFCTEIKGQLFTLKDQGMLEVIQSIISDNFSYWIMARCMSSGTCIQTDGSKFDPALYNVVPREKVESCAALEAGKIRLEMCTDKKRFICELYLWEICLKPDLKKAIN